ncbi:MAG: hypothetical protein AAF602_01980 [Myxococcota bacterium]
MVPARLALPALALLVACPADPEEADDRPSDDTRDTPEFTGDTGEPTGGSVTVGRLANLPGDAWIMVADAEGRFVRTLPHEGLEPVVVDDVPSGGAITVALSFDDSVGLRTVFDVQDGDVLIPAPDSDGAQAGTFRVEVGDPAVSHQAGNLDIGRCESISGGVTFPSTWNGPLLAGCQDLDGSLSVAAVARDFPDSRPLAIQTRTGIVPTGTAPDLLVDVVLDGPGSPPGSWSSRSPTRPTRAFELRSKQRASGTGTQDSRTSASRCSAPRPPRARRPSTPRFTTVFWWGGRPR